MDVNYNYGSLQVNPHVVPWAPIVFPHNLLDNDLIDLTDNDGNVLTDNG